MIDLGKTGYLECLVDANPISKEMIEWHRLKTSSSLLEDDDDNEDDAIELDNCIGLCATANKRSSKNRNRNDSEKTTENKSNNRAIFMQSGRIKASLEGNRSFLIIHNITENDSGTYECRAFNGIGKQDSSLANLVVKRKLNYCD